MFLRRNSFTTFYVHQIIVHLFALAGITIFLLACYTIYVSNTEIRYLVNQLWKMVNGLAKSHNQFHFFLKLPFIGKTSVLELFVYGIASGFLILVFGVAAMPFPVSYEPFQCLMNDTRYGSKIFLSFYLFQLHGIFSSSIALNFANSNSHFR